MIDLIKNQSKMNHCRYIFTREKYRGEYCNRETSYKYCSSCSKRIIYFIIAKNDRIKLSETLYGVDMSVVYDVFIDKTYNTCIENECIMDIILLHDCYEKPLNKLSLTVKKYLYEKLFLIKNIKYINEFLLYDLLSMLFLIKLNVNQIQSLPYK